MRYPTENSLGCVVATMFFFAALSASPALANNAGAIISGNVLVSSDEVLYEYTTAGAHVQSINIPPPTPVGSIESARDFAFDQNGNLYVYNGTFDPYLSILDAQTNSWSHRTFSGWSTVNNGTYGGIAVTENHAFVTDMRTFGDAGADEEHGIVRFDLNGSGATRFATDLQPIDLTLGLDGRLYALYPGGSPEGRFVDVFDPNTMSRLDQISLAAIFGHTGHRSIAVDSNGDIFVADWDGEVHHVDRNGVLVDTMSPICDWIGSDIRCEFYDIDISTDGMLILGSRFGEVFLTDTSFSEISTFDIPRGGGAFVGFAPAAIPEPGSLWLLLFSTLGVVARRKRN